MKAPARHPWEWTALEQWGRDLRYAARGLCRAPGFSLAVFCSLVVCIGPNAATLSALYSLVLKPLPFPAPAQLVTIVNVADKSGGQVVQSSTTQYLDFKTHADLFAGFATIRHDSATLDNDDAPIRVAKDFVAADFFRVLGVNPIAGRFFTADEEVAGRDRVVVLSQNFWEGHYNADARVIGSKVLMGGQPFTIVGVAPRSLEALSQQTCFFQSYAPAASKFDPQTRYRGDLALYARLKPGVSHDAGLAQLTVLEKNFLTSQAGPPLRALLAAAGYRLAIEPLRTGGWVGETNSLWLLQGGALLVLLIGCVNVVNLFLARMNAKRTELAIRVALGAGRAALLRQTLAESVLLTGAAAAAGIGVALLALRVFNRYLPVMVSGAPPVTLDTTVTFAMVAAAGGIALLVGFLPLQLLWRTGLRVGESRPASSGAGSRAVSGALVTTQVAVAVVLLVGASLLLRSFAKVMAIDPGFDAAHVVQARTALPARYNNAATRIGVQRRILESFREIPGVNNVAVSLSSVLLSNERPVPFGLRDEPVATGEGESQHLIHIAAVSPEFFAAMGMRVVSGRGFNDADEFPKNPVAVVDQEFVQRYFPGRIVEGQEIYLNWGFPLGVDAWPRIVGVVSRANFTGLDSRDNLPFVFVSTAGYASSGFNVLVRSPRPVSDLLREMRTKLHDVDPTLPLFAAGSLDDGLDNLLMARRGITLLLGLFSGLALLLAAIGLYGVLSYDVTQRTREIGIRGAIGASRGQIVGLIMRQGMGKTGVGLAVGLLGAFFLTRYLSTLLFGIVSADPISYAAVLTLLAGVSLLACWLPARRAAKVDPIVALRAE
jgi:putative ABC transport system permease protein